MPRRTLTPQRQLWLETFYVEKMQLNLASAVIKRLKGTIISGGFAHRILHIMHCITMSLQAVYPHFCPIIFGFGVYPVCNLLL